MNRFFIFALRVCRLSHLTGSSGASGISYPLSLYLDVLDIPEFRIEYDYTIVPVHPADPTNLTIRVFNDGNTEIGYDLFLQAPSGWSAGFTDLSADPGATSGSTGLIAKGGQMDVSICI